MDLFLRGLRAPGWRGGAGFERMLVSRQVEHVISVMQVSDAIHSHSEYAEIVLVVI